MWKLRGALRMGDVATTVQVLPWRTGSPLGTVFTGAISTLSPLLRAAHMHHSSLHPDFLGFQRSTEGMGSLRLFEGHLNR